MFTAAKELQKRQQEYKQLKKSNMYTRIGLWIAASALFANVIIELIRLKSKRCSIFKSIWIYRLKDYSFIIRSNGTPRTK
jgi:hypothetical protein